MTKATREDLINIIIELNVSASLDVGGLNDDTPLDKQGLDSLDIMNLYFQLEETFGIKISEDSLQEDEWRTISDILKRINETQ